MMAIAGGHRRALEVHCTCREDVSPDERQLLLAVARSQLGDVHGCEGLLDDLIKPGARDQVAEIAARLARRFREAGHLLGGTRVMSSKPAPSHHMMPAAAGVH